MGQDSILYGQGEYRKGLVLGLTMAEIVLLIIFSLLLALSILLLTKEEKIVELDEKLAELSKIAQLLEEKDLNNDVKELIKLSSEQKIIARLLEEFETYESSVPKKVEALVALNRKTDPLLKKLGKLNIRIDDPKFGENAKKLIDEAKHAADRQREISVLEKQISGLEKSISQTSSLGEQLVRVTQENKKLGVDIDQLNQERRRIVGVNKSLRKIVKAGGNGTQKPACWADPITGKAKYIYDVGLTSAGLIIRKREYPTWAAARNLPLLTVRSWKKIYSPGQFRQALSPILEWSKNQDCRFYVRVFDITKKEEKLIFKQLMRVLEGVFYKYEILDERWGP